MTTTYTVDQIGSIAGCGNELIRVKPSCDGISLTGGWITYSPTVTLVGGSDNTVPEYSTNSGRYFGLGKIIYCDVLLDGDGGNEGSGTGVINIALPATSGTSINNGDSWFYVGSFRNGTSEYILYGLLSVGSDTITLAYFNSISNITTVTGNIQNSTSRMIRLHFWYEVD